MSAWLVVAILLAIFGPVGNALAQTERRVALVLGNGAYQSATRLKNPPSDARAMAAKLRGLGFEVVESIDADQRKLREALSLFAAKLEGAAVGLFFYAGHGLQVGGQNYLVPIEAKLEREADLYVQTVNLSDALKVMEATVPVRLVFLDACRDNPLARRLAGAMGATRSLGTGQGLAKVDAAIGTLIAYATSPGNVAEDGEGTANSPFTTALLQHLDEPGLEVSQVLKRVRGAVLASTRNMQVPWDSSSLIGDFYFKAALPQSSAPAGATLPSADRETVFWQSVHPGNDVSAYEEYLRQFPKGLYAGLARNRIAALKQPQQAALVAPRVEAPTVRKPVVGTFDRSPGKVFRDCVDCPELVVVPAGRFEQGATWSERAWYLETGGKAEWARWELPRRPVTIAAAFALGTSEVTVGQFRRFAERTGHKAEGGCHIFDGKRWVGDKDRSWLDPGYPQTDDHPVVCVSWDDAGSYAAWLSGETGQAYRLPSESEWEYAARGSTVPTTAMRYWGDDKGNSEACAFANAADQTAEESFVLPAILSCRDGAVHTAPAGSYRANAFGLFDMLGNALEWTADPWHDSYDGAPDDGAVWTADGNLAMRAVRGGSSYDGPRFLRAADRVRFATDSRGASTGFRVVRTLMP